MKSGLRIIVTGLIAQYPLGGVTWDYLQYVVGLARMGHDVYYLEDTGQWPYDPQAQGTAKSAAYNVSYLERIMARFGLAERWAYRFPWQSQWFGLSDAKRNEVIAGADLIVNVSGCLANPASYRGAGRLAYIDSDPVFTQVKLARGQRDFRAMVDAHDVHFSFGEALGPAVPETGHHWLPTRQPVLLEEWAAGEDAVGCFTTIMNWSSYNTVRYQDVEYGQKDVEFMKFIDLPAAVEPARLELVMNAAGKNADPPLALIRRKGWSVVPPGDAAGDIDSYRNYIQRSRAEWSVAKHGYVIGRPGWFSCRSACYLAAGRPVVVQDTGFGAVLPTGVGLFAFTTLPEAADAILAVEADTARHARAARQLAGEYFDARKVLAALLERAGASSGTSAPEAAAIEAGSEG